MDRRQIENLRSRNLLGAHCTGIEAVYNLRQHMGLSRKAVLVDSAGAQFSLENGIVPGELER